jgi:hypothetical protein
MSPIMSPILGKTWGGGRPFSSERVGGGYQFFEQRLLYDGQKTVLLLLFNCFFACGVEKAPIQFFMPFLVPFRCDSSVFREFG